MGWGKWLGLWGCMLVAGMLLLACSERELSPPPTRHSVVLGAEVEAIFDRGCTDTLLKGCLEQEALKIVSVTSSTDGIIEIRDSSAVDGQVGVTFLATSLGKTFLRVEYEGFLGKNFVAELFIVVVEGEAEVNFRCDENSAVGRPWEENSSPVAVRAGATFSMNASFGGWVAGGELQPLEVKDFEILERRENSFKLRAPTEPGSYSWPLYGGREFIVHVFEPEMLVPVLLSPGEELPAAETLHGAGGASGSAGAPAMAEEDPSHSSDEFGDPRIEVVPTFNGVPACIHGVDQALMARVVEGPCSVGTAGIAAADVIPIFAPGGRAAMQIWAQVSSGLADCTIAATYGGPEGRTERRRLKYGTRAKTALPDVQAVSLGSTSSTIEPPSESLNYSCQPGKWDDDCKLSSPDWDCFAGSTWNLGGPAEKVSEKLWTGSRPLGVDLRSSISTSISGPWNSLYAPLDLSASQDRGFLGLGASADALNVFAQGCASEAKSRAVEIVPRKDGSHAIKLTASNIDDTARFEFEARDVAESLLVVKTQRRTGEQYVLTSVPGPFVDAFSWTKANVGAIYYSEAGEALVGFAPLEASATNPSAKISRAWIPVLVTGEEGTVTTISTTIAASTTQISVVDSKSITGIGGLLDTSVERGAMACMTLEPQGENGPILGLPPTRPTVSVNGTAIAFTDTKDHTFCIQAIESGEADVIFAWGEGTAQATILVP